MNAFFDTGYKEILLKLGFGGKKGKKQGRRYTAAHKYSSYTKFGFGPGFLDAHEPGAQPPPPIAPVAAPPVAPPVAPPGAAAAPVSMGTRVDSILGKYKKMGPMGRYGLPALGMLAAAPLAVGGARMVSNAFGPSQNRQ